MNTVKHHREFFSDMEEIFAYFTGYVQNSLSKKFLFYYCVCFFTTAKNKLT